jgi:hypothetical protein
MTRRRRLARAGDIADALASDLTRARDIASTLYFTIGLDPDSDRDLVRDLDRARDRASGIASNLARARTLPSDLTRARALASTLDRARGQALQLERGLDRDHYYALNLAGGLCTALESAGASALVVISALEQAHARGLANGLGLVGGSARRLAAAAVRLLPAADRARYAEEYLSELQDLARAGESRRRQAAYALRQLRSALVLRGELLAPSRRKAAP